ncbi:YozQ family protein [Paenibacillus sp. GCM10023248]|uniref:YozQ family protein n=1 Tax=Bacillales TaxID=1385 RepID=UPI0023781EE6|nr:MULTISPECIES: YozQ family protein [Bacillales]MDD9267158.1 YozQ family protein [Paenibacillus sp. MAHUQ-63]MDR6881381.1 hypothetical protein [Bacillus sp. 3255]
MKNDKKSKDRELQGNALTHEQLSDVYAAGTSDGIHELAEGKIKITNETSKDLSK